MTQYAIVTDLNRCVSCLACTTACKEFNNVPIGSFWLKILRIGPNPINEGDKFPNVEMYYLPVTCQHCKTPECTRVCPTGASHKQDDGTVQIDKEKCIGCQFCVMACPYGVRYLNQEQRVVEKCTMCQQLIAENDVPRCVESCGGRARWFGDIEQGIESFIGTHAPGSEDQRCKILDYCKPWTDAQVYEMPDKGNQPTYKYILRGRKWRG